MKNLFLPVLLLSLLLCAHRPAEAKRPAKTQASALPVDPARLPRSIFSGQQGPFHVQGIAVDLKNGYVYFSFTTELLKTDLQGKLIGSVVGMTGHLGCLTTNPADGRIYGSL